MNRKTKFSIDLELSSINIKTVTIDSLGDYHLYISCTATTTSCYKCGKMISKSHGQCEESIIEHLPILEHRVFLHVKWPRFKCDACDNTPTSSFRPEWLNETGELTKAYENFCLKFLINSTIKDVSEKLRTTEEIIEGVINRNIKTSIDWEQICPIRHHLADLSYDENKRIEYLFELEPALRECYKLREELYEIFETKKNSKQEGKEKIDVWCEKAEKYKTKGFNPFISFIKTYKNYQENILNYFTHHASSGAVEGLNNKIKVIKRRGFGFRNITNFAKRLFLDINYKPILLPAV